MPHKKLSTDDERFWRFVNKEYKSTGCWIWMKPLQTSGYGQMSTGSRALGTFRNRGSHVFALELALGRPLNEGMCVCHVCDNRACVRNDDEGWYEVNGVLRIRRGHLFEGTTQDNTADRHAKGRTAAGNLNGAHLHPEVIERGEIRYNAKFNENDIRSIRARVGNGEKQSDIAREYDVGTTTIFHIVHRDNWRHVE